MRLMLHEVRVRRRTIFWWAFGLAAFGLMYLGFYPSIADEFADIDIASIEFYEAMGVTGMATFEDYMMSTVLNILPLLVGAFGIVLGTGALAGEEGAGTLEPLAALPISRLRLYAAKAAALLVTSLVVMLAVAAMVTALFVMLDAEIDTSVTAADLFGAVMSLWLVAFVFLAAGMFLGALLPSRARQPPPRVPCWWSPSSPTTWRAWSSSSRPCSPCSRPTGPAAWSRCSRRMWRGTRCSSSCSWAWRRSFSARSCSGGAT